MVETSETTTTFPFGFCHASKLETLLAIFHTFIHERVNVEGGIRAMMAED